MSEEKSAYERGLDMIEKVYAGDVVRMPEGTMAFYDVMMKSLFAEVWDRDVLSIRDRRLMLLGAIAPTGNGDIWKIQIKAALKNGEITPDEAREALIILAPYGGYPSVSGLIGPTEEAINEAAAEAESATE